MARIERESINFKLPRPLCDALRAKARQLNTTATDLVIQGLYHVLELPDSTDSSIEARLHRLSEKLANLTTNDSEDTEKRLTNLEQKLEAQNAKLEQLERLFVLGQQQSQSKGRKYSQPYASQFQQPPLELQPFEPQNLAQRLGLGLTRLTQETERLSTKDFISYTRGRDPRGIGWQFEEKSGLYYPVK